MQTLQPPVAARMPLSMSTALPFSEPQMPVPARMTMSQNVISFSHDARMPLSLSSVRPECERGNDLPRPHDSRERRDRDKPARVLLSLMNRRDVSKSARIPLSLETSNSSSSFAYDTVEIDPDKARPESPCPELEQDFVIDQNPRFIFFTLDSVETGQREEQAEPNKRKFDDEDLFWSNMIEKNMELEEREVLLPQYPLTTQIKRRKRIREETEAKILSQTRITDGPVPTAHSIDDIDRAISRYVVCLISSDAGISA